MADKNETDLRAVCKCGHGAIRHANRDGFAVGACYSPLESPTDVPCACKEFTPFLAMPGPSLVDLVKRYADVQGRREAALAKVRKLRAELNEAQREQMDLGLDHIEAERALLAFALEVGR